MGSVAALLASLAIVAGFVWLAAAWDAPIYLLCAATVALGAVASTLLVTRRHH